MHAAELEHTTQPDQRSVAMLHCIPMHTMLFSSTGRRIHGNKAAMVHDSLEGIDWLMPYCDAVIAQLSCAATFVFKPFVSSLRSVVAAAGQSSDVSGLEHVFLEGEYPGEPYRYSCNTCTPQLPSHCAACAASNNHAKACNNAYTVWQL